MNQSARVVILHQLATHCPPRNTFPHKPSTGTRPPRAVTLYRYIPWCETQNSTLFPTKPTAEMTTRFLHKLAYCNWSFFFLATNPGSHSESSLVASLSQLKRTASVLYHTCHCSSRIAIPLAVSRSYRVEYGTRCLYKTKGFSLHQAMLRHQNIISSECR
jgi:hypothetical protein